jgi:hypothetical protein
VLFLRHAPKTLTEDDFRRIIPKGRHIPSWKLKGDILKGLAPFPPIFWSPLVLISIVVIPVRDPKTLMHLGHYYLLFSSIASAGAYRAHVSRLHRLSKAYTPDTSTSPLPPPPAYLVDDISGEDVHTLLQDYALVPPSQDMHLMFVKYPYPRPVQQLIDNGGYGQLSTWDCNLTNMVLFSIDGAQPSTNRVRMAISQDGKDRSLHWGINNIVKVGDRIANFRYGTWDEDTALGQAHLVRRVAASASRQVAQLGKGITAPWLVTLRDGVEAKRFVRAWNQRAFPMSNNPASDDPPPVVKAELVW